jgi:prepilin-type N-terminal cleavage/methylation domain-containing protein
MRKAFTLIELLVVIAIIAILAAILFPVFAQAKNAAKKSSDLSNQKQMGLGIAMYSGDFDDVYPSAYFHRAFNPADGGTRAGYIHWSAMTYPYVKNWDIYKSPGDKINGHAPTCFSSADNNSGKGWPGGQSADRCPDSGDPRTNGRVVGGSIVDDQAPRLSYTVNSAVIPRLRNIRDINEGGIAVVSQSALDAVSGTIVIAGLTDSLECLNGQSLGTGIRNSSHRSTNAVTRDTGNQTPYFGENTDGRTTPLYALNYAAITGNGNLANSLFERCKQGVGNLPLITYHSAFRWNEGDNYAMADGSAKYSKFNATLNPSRYMWGAKMYTAGGTVILDPVTGNPVTQ